MLVRYDDGIGAQYDIVRTPCENRPGFVAGQSPCVNRRLFIRERLFRNVCRLDDERNASVAE